MKFDRFAMVRRSNDAWFGFRAPAWEPTLTAELKNVPIRAWDPETKTWWFPLRWYHVVRSLAEPYFKGEKWPSVEDLDSKHNGSDFIRRMAALTGYDSLTGTKLPESHLEEWIRARIPYWR